MCWMSFKHPRLRGSAPRRTGPYPFGQIPDSVIRGVGRLIVHRLAVGQGDIRGDDFGTIFAEAINGEHRASPLGVADVVANGCAWSVKTLQNRRPFDCQRVRLISGRNSPDYSLGISDPRADVQKTGNAVISVWNARIDQAMDEYEDLRIVVLVRNVEAKEFVIFEEEATRFSPGDFAWTESKRGTFQGRNVSDGTHQFTWQPSGGQFTIFRQVPGSARKFRIRRNVPIATVNDFLNAINYSDDWISIDRPGSA